MQKRSYGHLSYHHYARKRSGLSTSASVAIVAIIVAVAGVASVTLLTQNAAPSTTSSASKSSIIVTPTSSTTQIASSTSAINQAQKVSLMLDYLPVGYDTPFYYGLDQGIYLKNGIDLNIIAGSGSAGTIAAVAAGKIDFGFADSGTLVVGASSNVTNVKIITMIFQKSIYALLYNKATITKIGDLNGKSCATTQSSGGITLFPLLARLNKINMSSVHFVYASAAVHAQLVALGKTDCEVGAIGDLINVGDIAGQNNIQLSAFLYSDYGLDIYGHAIITTNSMISNNPDLVRRFVNATMQSLVKAAHHPSDAVSSFVKHNPQSSYAKSFDYFEAHIKCCITNVNSTTNALNLGWVDSQKFQNMVTVLSQGYGITSPAVASNLYTDQFVLQPK